MSAPGQATDAGSGAGHGQGAAPALVVLAAGRARRYGGVKPLAPVGTFGEAVIDLLCSDARAAGFGQMVLVIGPATGPAIRYHVEQTWPGDLDCRFALQEAPLGTVHAVLSAVPHLPERQPFGVCNADDLYGEEALRVLCTYLSSSTSSGEHSMPAENALVGFRLANAIVGEGSVTRGVCTVNPDGRLVSIDERRQVSAGGNGGFVSADGREPAALEGDALVSMNLWGFIPEMVGVFREAMTRAGSASEDAEILLPEVIDHQLRHNGAGGAGGGRFRVLPTESRCIGVTHPDDLALVQADIATQVGTGQRSERLWGATE